MKTNLIALAIAVFACGCSPEPPTPPKPTGPSYAEAVATYQAELAILDGMEAKLADAKAKLEKELVAIKSRFESEQKKTDELDAIAFGGYSDKEKAKAFIADNQKYMETMKSIRDQETSLANSAYKRIATPLAAEIESQRASVAKAKALRDSLSP